jgi:hypothetical protein
MYCNSRYHWQKSDPNAYMAAYRNRWLDICCAEMKTIKPPEVTFEECQKMALMAGNKKAWSEHDPRTYRKALNKRWVEACLLGLNEPKPYSLFPLHYGWGVGYRDFYQWTFETCKQSASRYGCRYHWQLMESGAYQAARRHGWLEQMSFHSHSNYLTFPPYD